MRKQIGPLAIAWGILVIACGESSSPKDEGPSAGAGGAGGSGDTSGQGGSGGGGNAGTGGNPTFCEICENDGYLCWSNDCRERDLTCITRPDSCPAEGRPVCGCDGEVYASECEAQRARADIGRHWDCEPPAGFFGCGIRLFCKTGEEYCAVGNRIENNEECRLLPEDCGDDPTCDCVYCTPDVPEDKECSEPAPDELQVVCNTLISPSR